MCVVLRIYYKIILEIVTRIAVRVVTEMFQLSLSLGSFKNSFVGDFATLTLNPSPRPIVTRPHYNHIKKLLGTIPATILRNG